MTGLTIVYVTARREPQLKWFLHGLMKQLDRFLPVQVVVVDYHHAERDRMVERAIEATLQVWNNKIEVKWTAPLPSFCQGDFKLTKENYFDASIARNTGFVCAKYDYVAFVDDVSVLMPGWLRAVLEGRRNNEIILGAYEKHSKMHVESGILIASKVEEHDKDSRLRFVSAQDAQKIRGHASWFYGCSFAMPLELALEVNGFDEMCAITGYEDVNFGLRLEKAGCKFWYDPRMKTVESIEHHSNDVVMKRIDPEISVKDYCLLLAKFGLLGDNPPQYERYDASHFELDVVKRSAGYRSFGNSFSLRDLREKVLSGGFIGVEDMNFPERFWFTGELLREM